MGRHSGGNTGKFAPDDALNTIPERHQNVEETPHPYNGQDPLNTRFPSVDAMLEWLDKSLGKDRKVSMDNGRLGGFGGYEWTFGHDTAQTLHVARVGWQAGAAEVGGAHVNAANAALATMNEQGTVADVSGCMVDVAAYIAGIPECMIDFDNVPREVRSVRILVDGYVSAGVGAEEVFKRGVAIMAAVLAVQASGVAVTVDMVIGHRLHSKGINDQKVQRMAVTLHSPGEVMDTSRLAFYLAHPAFTRLAFIGGSFCLAGAHNSNSYDVPKLPRKAGEIYVNDLYLGQHPWGTPEANAALIKTIFEAAK